MHGTNSHYIRYKCRCEECKKAHSDYMKKWRKGNRYFVDAKRAREVIELLIIDGESIESIAKKAGVSLSTVKNILYRYEEQTTYQTHKKIMELDRWTGRT